MTIINGPHANVRSTSFEPHGVSSDPIKGIDGSGMFWKKSQMSRAHRRRQACQVGRTGAPALFVGPSAFFGLILLARKTPPPSRLTGKPVQARARPKNLSPFFEGPLGVIPRLFAARGAMSL